LILDTNALSAAAKREPAVVADAQRLALPVIVLGEFRLGIAASRYRATYEAWLDDWVSAVEVLDIDKKPPIPTRP
jgi:predicted nucleic acid-binding protein